MAAKFFTSTLWTDWICKFDLAPTQAEIDAAQMKMENRVRAIVNFYNAQPSTAPTNLLPIFQWSKSPLEPLTYNLKVYLQGDVDRPPGGPGGESIKNPPPPPPPPPL